MEDFVGEDGGGEGGGVVRLEEGVGDVVVVVVGFGGGCRGRHLSGGFLLRVVCLGKGLMVWSSV